jgi:hypothetical protein
MAALFPPWSNTAARVAIASIAAAGVGALAALLVFVRTPWRRHQFEPPDQPVTFDHRHHVQDDGIDCLYCHNTADRAATAGIPSTDKCMGCHSQVWAASVQLEPVRRSYFSGAPIPWSRVHRVPDFVYFNHAIHVNKGIGCATCHGRVDQMPAVYQVAPLTMAWCLDCHRAPEAALRPLSEITNMRWDSGAVPREERRRLAELYGVRSLTNCTTCHR